MTATILDCGGKQSATPLWAMVWFAKAVSALSVCQFKKFIFATKHFTLATTQSEKDALPTIAARVLRTLPQMNPLAKPSLTQDPAEWLGDAHPLVAQLGTADGLASLHAMAGSLLVKPITSLAALREFLQTYHERILLPHELPAIQTAFNHISRNEVRELISFDQQLASEPMLRDFANASQRIGRDQLQKLRPLRDERMVQRYLTAVESGQAHGWHTLVYGMTLVLYSLPLRQGLLGYAHQTTRGFIHAAARGLQLKESECRALFEELCEGIVLPRDAMTMTPV